MRIRVYATQSTHKTLSSLRQGSMIHIWDEDFQRKSEAAFHEAYMTHTSTSPNYQILASLDVGRRQVQFEGYELVEKAIELGMMLRRTIREHREAHASGSTSSPSASSSPRSTARAASRGTTRARRDGTTSRRPGREDEFALDPTKINLFTGKTGIDGDTFKNRYLMDKYAIQVNKTSRNSVLFMTNIGTTRGSLAYLTKVLLEIAARPRAAERGHGARRRRAAPGHDPVADRGSAAAARTSAASTTRSSGRAGRARAATCARRTSWRYDEQRCAHVQLRGVPRRACAAGESSCPPRS